MDKKKFEEARNKIIGRTRERVGIGTLKEKTVHAVLKHYYAPHEEMHEVPIGNYVADIFTGDAVLEIQNGNFYKIRPKLDAFLKKYPVTIIYPIPHHKWLIWIDEETGELSPKRKSPLTGSAYRAFIELYRIKSYLKNERLHFIFPLVDMEEYRLLNGWSKDRKKGSCRYDRIPIALFDEIVIQRREDYLQFLPMELPDAFTSRDLAKAAKIPLKIAGMALHILAYLDIIERIGKKGRSNLYRVNMSAVYCGIEDADVSCGKALSGMRQCSNERSVKFVPEVVPEPEELEALRAGRRDRKANGTIPHEAIHWD